MKYISVLCILSLSLLTACGKSGEDRLVERAQIEGEATKKGELIAQKANEETIIEQARKEGKAQAEAQFEVQIKNQSVLLEQARAEGKAQSEAQLKINNENLDLKSLKMEEDLAQRHLFFQAIKGIYEGRIQTEKGEFKIRVIFIPSIQPYKGDRIRQLEEISADINNLYLNAQIIQWNPANPLSSVGCRVENIRPDIINGEIAIASSSCPNLYMFEINSDQVFELTSKMNESPKAAQLAKQILEKRINVVQSIQGMVSPTTNSSTYNFEVKKIGDKKK